MVRCKTIKAKASLVGSKKKMKKTYSFRYLLSEAAVFDQISRRLVFNKVHTHTHTNPESGAKIIQREKTKHLTKHCAWCLPYKI